MDSERDLRDQKTTKLLVILGCCMACILVGVSLVACLSQTYRGKTVLFRGMDLPPISVILNDAFSSNLKSRISPDAYLALRLLRLCILISIILFCTLASLVLLPCLLLNLSPNALPKELSWLPVWSVCFVSIAVVLLCDHESQKRLELKRKPHNGEPVLLLSDLPPEYGTCMGVRTFLHGLGVNPSDILKVQTLNGSLFIEDNCSDESEQGVEELFLLPHKCGAALVTLVSRREALLLAAQGRVSSRHQATISWAPESGEIIQHNLKVPLQVAAERSRISRWILWLGLVLFPVTLLLFRKALRHRLLLIAATDSWLPGLLLGPGLPALLRFWAVKIERSRSKRAVDTSVVIRLLALNSINVAVTVFGVFNDIHLALNDARQILPGIERSIVEIGLRAPKLGAYCAWALIGKSVGLSWSLLTPFRWFKKDCQPRSVNIPVVLATHLFVLGLFMAVAPFSIAVPVLGIVYFSSAWLIYAFMFLYMHQSSYDTGGAFWPQVHKTLLGCAIFTNVALISANVGRYGYSSW